MHARNPSTCACMCHKDCEIGKYFKDCKCRKCLVDNIVVTCDEVVDTPESAVINLNDGTDYWFIAVVLLPVVSLLLLLLSTTLKMN